MDFDKKQFIHLVNKKKEYKMKNQILSLTLSLVVLFFFVSSVSFAQNQPVKKDVKNNKQEITKETQEHTGTTQDQMKKNESKVNNQMDTKRTPAPRTATRSPPVSRARRTPATEQAHGSATAATWVSIPAGMGWRPFSENLMYST